MFDVKHNRLPRKVIRGRTAGIQILEFNVNLNFGPKLLSNPGSGRNFRAQGLNRIAGRRSAVVISI
jgi:hypothetical protein